MYVLIFIPYHANSQLIRVYLKLKNLVVYGWICEPLKDIKRPKYIIFHPLNPCF
jgi:hypothetical protein